MQRFVSCGLALALSAAACRACLADEPGLQELCRQVQALQARVDAMNACANQARQVEVDRIVHSVLADAEQRTGVFAAQETASAGYSNGFFIRSADGSFLLKPALQWQFRNVTTFRSDTGQDDVENGFETRRLRLRLDGNAMSPDLTYAFVFDTSRSTGNVSLLDGYVQYQFAGDWAVKAGQYREAFAQEYNVSPYSQLATDRSLASYALGGGLVDRVQGAALIYGSKANPLRVEVAVHDGANSKNTNYLGPDTNPTQWGAAARAEYKLAGDWASYRDFTAKGTRTELFIVGAGVDATERENSLTYLTTIDAQYENPDGLSTFAALHANFTDLRNTAQDDSRVDWGFVVQAEYAFGGNWEIFGRSAFVEFDGDLVDGGEDVIELTAGSNYYLGSQGSLLHRAKFTLDVVYLPDGSPISFEGAGILASKDDEIVVRGQFIFQI